MSIPSSDSLQMQFDFTAPVAGLPQMPQTDGNLYCPPQPSAYPQAPTQDDALPQDEYDAGDAMDGPPSENYTQPSTAPQGPAWSQHVFYAGYHANRPPGAYYGQPSAGVAAAPQGYGWPQLGYHPAPFYPGQQPQTVAGPPFPYQQPQAVTGLPYPFQQPQTVAGPFDLGYINYATGPFPQDQHAPLQMASGGGSTVQPPSTGCVKRYKRRACHSVPPETLYIAQRPLKRRRPNPDENAQGKFGPYTVAGASATVMPMPFHDPQPVNISNRRTHDPDGNPLRTRRFGMMELEDYPSASNNIADHQSPGLICVRPCNWSKDPCGLFIEMDTLHVEDHLWFWHGVTMEHPTFCQFKDCWEPAPMSNLGRHIEDVHFAKCFQCPYCKKLCSRSDSLRRHQLVCTALLYSRQQAMEGRHDFHLDEGVESMQGYMVPAQSAT